MDTRSSGASSALHSRRKNRVAGAGMLPDGINTTSLLEGHEYKQYRQAWNAMKAEQRRKIREQLEEEEARRASEAPLANESTASSTKVRSGDRSKKLSPKTKTKYGGSPSSVGVVSNDIYTGIGSEYTGLAALRELTLMKSYKQFVQQREFDKKREFKKAGRPSDGDAPHGTHGGSEKEVDSGCDADGDTSKVWVSETLASEAAGLCGLTLLHEVMNEKSVLQTPVPRVLPRLPKSSAVTAQHSCGDSDMQQNMSMTVERSRAVLRESADFESSADHQKHRNRNPEVLTEQTVREMATGMMDVHRVTNLGHAGVRRRLEESKVNGLLDERICAVSSRTLPTTGLSGDGQQQSHAHLSASPSPRGNNASQDQDTVDWVEHHRSAPDAQPAVFQRQPEADTIPNNDPGDDMLMNTAASMNFLSGNYISDSYANCGEWSNFQGLVALHESVIRRIEDQDRQLAMVSASSVSFSGVTLPPLYLLHLFDCFSTRSPNVAFRRRDPKVVARLKREREIVLQKQRELWKKITFGISNNGIPNKREMRKILHPALYKREQRKLRKKKKRSASSNRKHKRKEDSGTLAGSHDAAADEDNELKLQVDGSTESDVDEASDDADSELEGRSSPKSPAQPQQSAATPSASGLTPSNRYKVAQLDKHVKLRSSGEEGVSSSRSPSRKRNSLQMSSNEVRRSADSTDNVPVIAALSSMAPIIGVPVATHRSARQLSTDDVGELGASADSHGSSKAKLAPTRTQVHKAMQLAKEHFSHVKQLREVRQEATTPNAAGSAAFAKDNISAASSTMHRRLILGWRYVLLARLAYSVSISSQRLTQAVVQAMNMTGCPYRLVSSGTCVKDEKKGTCAGIYALLGAAGGTTAVPSLSSLVDMWTPPTPPLRWTLTSTNFGENRLPSYVAAIADEFFFPDRPYFGDIGVELVDFNPTDEAEEEEEEEEEEDVDDVEEEEEEESPAAANKIGTTKRGTTSATDDSTDSEPDSEDSASKAATPEIKARDSKKEPEQEAASRDSSDESLDFDSSDDEAERNGKDRKGARRPSSAEKSKDVKEDSSQPATSGKPSKADRAAARKAERAERRAAERKQKREQRLAEKEEERSKLRLNIHAKTLRAARQVVEKLRVHFEACGNEYEDLRHDYGGKNQPELHFTGHAGGAAVALVAAMLLAKDTSCPFLVPHVVLFGCPKVFANDPSEVYSKLNIHIDAFANSWDPAPFLPLAWPPTSDLLDVGSEIDGELERFVPEPLGKMALSHELWKANSIDRIISDMARHIGAVSDAPKRCWTIRPPTLDSMVVDFEDMALAEDGISKELTAMLTEVFMRYGLELVDKDQPEARRRKVGIEKILFPDTLLDMHKNMNPPLPYYMIKEGIAEVHNGFFQNRRDVIRRRKETKLLSVRSSRSMDQAWDLATFLYWAKRQCLSNPRHTLSFLLAHHYQYSPNDATVLSRNMRLQIPKVVIPLKLAVPMVEDTPDGVQFTVNMASAISYVFQQYSRVLPTTLFDSRCSGMPVMQEACWRRLFIDMKCEDEQPMEHFLEAMLAQLEDRHMLQHSAMLMDYYGNCTENGFKVAMMMLWTRFGELFMFHRMRALGFAGDMRLIVGLGNLRNIHAKELRDACECFKEDGAKLKQRKRDDLTFRKWVRHYLETHVVEVEESSNAQQRLRESMPMLDNSSFAARSSISLSASEPLLPQKHLGVSTDSNKLLSSSHGTERNFGTSSFHLSQFQAEQKHYERFINRTVGEEPKEIRSEFRRYKERGVFPEVSAKHTFSTSRPMALELYKDAVPGRINRPSTRERIISQRNISAQSGESPDVQRPSRWSFAPKANRSGSKDKRSSSKKKKDRKQHAGGEKKSNERVVVGSFGFDPKTGEKFLAPRVKDLYENPTGVSITLRGGTLEALLHSKKEAKKVLSVAHKTLEQRDPFDPMGRIDDEDEKKSPREARSPRAASPQKTTKQ